jgi:hypothetical protein
MNLDIYLLFVYSPIFPYGFLVYEKDDMNLRTNFYHAVEILLSKVN